MEVEEEEDVASLWFEARVSSSLRGAPAAARGGKGSPWSAPDCVLGLRMACN